MCAAAAALVVGAAPGSARAAGAADHGTAAATTAWVGLDVKLLNGGVDVPVALALNEIRAPGDTSRTAASLSARIDGVEGGSLELVRSDVGRTSATADADGSRASVDLLHARLRLPGLPFTDVLGLDEVSAVASCPAAGRPSSSADILGRVTLLGRPVRLTAYGPVRVAVPGIGSVALGLSEHRSDSDSAAASALRLTVSVNPLKLNVAQVTGTVTLGQVSCRKAAATGGGPGSGGSGATGSGGAAGGPQRSAPASAPVGGASPTPVGEAAVAARTTRLAESGGGGGAGYLVAAGAVLVALGAAVSLGVRRRRRAARR